MKKKRCLYALLLVFVYCGTCSGQNTTKLLKENIKSETNDSITSYGPNTMVRNIKKGSNGTILIAASFAGVFRYDGASFTNLTRKIGSRRFWDVLEDRRGNLWFSSTDSGVYCYSGQSLRHFTTREGLASNAAMSIYEDKAGIIWFGTGGGVSRYDGKSFRNFTTKDGLSNNNVSSILEDRTGKLWFGTRGYLSVYDGKTFTTPTDNDGKAFYNVWSVIEDRNGNIYLGGSVIDYKKGDTLIVSAGIWRYDGKTFNKVTQRGAYAIIEDKKGNIWTTGAINPNGVGIWTLSCYDQKALYNKKPKLTEIKKGGPAFLGILEANDGSIWFGSMSGVYRYNGKIITDFKRKEGKKYEQ
jgi:ligand-binding sensor domain-containing protein